MVIEKPDLEWEAGGPVSRYFGDSYYSKSGGLEETRSVYLAGCGLPGRWADRKLFRVGELGFGTGLNMLALWDIWRRTRPRGARLVAASIEGFPLSATEAARAHADFPEIAALSARMLAQWPAASPGPHFLNFPEDGFALTVFHGPVEGVLTETGGAFDAWFLDGFAPSKNPDMWSPQIMARVAALSAPGARIGTFTVAGAVRRALADAGFAVEKREGFGRKRERLEAVLLSSPVADAAPDPLPRGAPVDGPVLVLGGGIAGCAMAAALRTRGREAVIVSAGQPASLPPRALLTPRLENADRPHANALFSAFLHAARLYRGIPGAVAAEGGLRMSGDQEGAERLAELAARWPGQGWTGQAMEMTRAATLDPAAILAALAGDTLCIEAHVAEIRHDGGQWRLLDEAGAEIAAAPALVLAGGAAGAELAALAPLELGWSGGQVSLHAAARPPAMLATWGGFAAPAGGRIMIGATHDTLDGAAPPPPDPDRARALAVQAAARLASEFAPAPEPLEIWTAVRAITRDRMPCAGPVPAREPYRAAFAALATGRKAAAVESTMEEIFPPGLFALTGFGSRGFAHAPLLAESVAAEICGEPSPLEAAGRRALHPARFLWRALRRA